MPVISCKLAHDPEWADQTGNAIRLQAKFDHLGDEEVSFIASSTDCEAHGRELFQRAIAGEFGPIADYQPPTLEELEQEVRYERNARLSATDWTQTPDVPESTREKWRPYRQALRDVPQQTGFPTDVVWPVPPN